MAIGYWREVLGTGLEVPDDRPLAELTAELTTMLGSTDAEVRDGTAYPALTTWIQRGVYDDLLRGLGDGMADGLQVGLGESGTDSVFRRSFSALVLGECLHRTTTHHLLPGDKVLEWGDRLASWLVREQDLRGYVVGKGWAHAVAHGADALGMLAGSPHLAAPELTVLLDVVADRLLVPGSEALRSGEPDRLAAATMCVLRRDVVSMSVIEPWLVRVGRAARPFTDADRDPYLDAAAPQAFLRALYLQVSLGLEPPRARPDLILALVEVLRATDPLLTTPPRR